MTEHYAPAGVTPSSLDNPAGTQSRRNGIDRQRRLA